jgi:aspartyl-tRNA(Asn)/glutamyl-tRNA(Gln) amidotransferase subunit C
MRPRADFNALLKPLSINSICYPTPLNSLGFERIACPSQTVKQNPPRVMSLSAQDIERIAHLARIRVTTDEVVQVQSKLEGIFKLIDEMQSVDTKGVEPMSHGLDMVLRLRDDVVTETDQREKFQSNAPEAAEGYFLVPKVIE